jgi:hypothetical protein
MARTGQRKAKRRTLYALIAQQEDLQDKIDLAKYGPTFLEDWPFKKGVLLNCFLEPIDVIHPGDIAYAWNEFRKEKKWPCDDGSIGFEMWCGWLLNYIYSALHEWRPEDFERLAAEMRRAERGDFEPLRGARTAHERDMAVAVLDAEFDKANIKCLAEKWCRKRYGNTENVESTERHMRRLRKRFGLPPRRKAT